LKILSVISSNDRGWVDERNTPLNVSLSVVAGAISIAGALLASWGLGCLFIKQARNWTHAIIVGFLALHVALVATYAVLPLSGWVPRFFVFVMACFGVTKVGVRRLALSRAVLAVALVVMGLVALALVPVTNYDASFYYHSMIAHLRNDNVVLGLANLHHRLGNWSGSMSLAALLESGPWGGDGFRLANPLFIAVAMIAVVPRIGRTIRGCPSAGDLLVVVATPICLARLLASPGFYLAAPTPDSGFALASILAIAAIVDAVTGAESASLVDLVVWSVLGAFYRPTGMILVVVSGVLLHHSVIRAQVGCHRGLLKMAALGVAAHMAITIALTGFPVFPVTALPDVFSWSVPREVRAYQTRLVLTIAREAGQPGAGDDWSWIGPWLQRNKFFLRDAGVLFAGGLPLMVLSVGRERARQVATALFLVTLPVVLWFFTSPDPRFGLGSVFALSAFPVAIALSSRNGRSSVRRLGVLVAGGVASIAIASGVATLFDRDLSNDLGNDAHVGTPKQIVLEAEGLTFTRPRADPGCGAALWCTPEDVSGLRVDNRGPFTVLSRD